MGNIKGVILAGGLGSRLYPLTRVINKHLLPVYDKPMVYYPLQKMVDSGIRDIMVISGPQHIRDFEQILGSGKDFGARLVYEVQEKPGGIAQALGLAKGFVGNGNVLVILGDNIIEDRIDTGAFTGGARIWLKKMKNPGRFGVAEIKDNRVMGIEEKPSTPKSDLVVIGCYMYDSSVFEVIGKMKASARNEMEISDVNNHYAGIGKMDYRILGGFWADAGTFEDLFIASEFARNKALARG